MPRHFKPSEPPKPKAAKGGNRIRIIGGTWRSRVIEFRDADGVRPTANRVRETLFNWLGQTLHGKRCLDLFSGSGALGFEAASRGASECVMLEINAAAVAALKKNQQNLAATSCRVVAMDALKFIGLDREKFDIVFVDPPFASGAMDAVLGKLPPLLLDDALVYAEWGTPIAEVLENMPGHPWEIAKQGRAGAVHFALLRAKV
jgi:16S rRNA (guanine966-N2)-methyltransferase